MAEVGITVVGAGVVGLACAARLASPRRDLVVLERQPRHGLETSSRNSEVIHAGVYYPEGTWKARLCVEGNRRLYEFCARNDVPHRQLGKIITAADPGQIPVLEELERLARANGAPIERLTADQALQLEPNIRSAGALLSPTTGIVSAHGLMDCLLHRARSAGAVVQFQAELAGIERRRGDYLLTVTTPSGSESFTSERVVNAAGLEADTVAELAGIEVDSAGYRLHYCKGSYFSAAPSRAGLISRLVYPVPAHASLGMHAVLGLDGRLRFGPDAEYLDDRGRDYRVDEAKRPAFGRAVRRIIPAIGDEDLTPDIAGIRPKLQGPGEDFRDFVVVEESAHGLPGLVSLVGIESPGLTAALAIAEHVARLIQA